jgi:hypothetical protein
MDSKKSLLVIGACLAYAALWAWTFNDGRFLWLVLNRSRATSAVHW